MGLWDIEVEPEVRAWLENLPKRDFGHVLAHVEQLAEEADTLGEPYSRYLGDKTRELRIPLHPLDVRVTYLLAPGRRECEASHERYRKLPLAGLRDLNLIVTKVLIQARRA